MRTRPLGESGIEASVVALGTWAIGGWTWGGTDEKESIDAIHAALDNGITMIDTAAMYGMGKAEELVGKALKGGLRHQVVLATKCTMVWDGTGEDGTFAFGSDDLDRTNDPNPKFRVFRNNHPRQVRKSLEESLRRLGTDYIDLFQTHWQDATVPIEDTMAELLRLKKEGKIRAIGTCNASVEDLERYRSVGRLASDQEKYSMLDRKPEEANLPYCQKNKLAFLAYSPLGKGLLTGAVGPDRIFAPGDARNVDPRFTMENRLKMQDFLSAIRPIADDAGLTLAQLVTAWTLAQPGCSHVLLGARNVKQAKENAAGGRAVLTEDAVKAISAAIAERLRGVDQPHTA